VTFLWTAQANRMTWRYGDRGYRYLHLDAGHVCQNLYLSAQVIGCGVCAIAAFDDEYMNAVIGLDGEEQLVVYVAALGKRQEAF
jgi:SagB-type dehydrogenase family enzyme